MTIDSIDVQAAVNGIIRYGCGRQLHDLYKDLRRVGSCVPVCSLLIAALEATRLSREEYRLGVSGSIRIRRAQAIAALKRLSRWASRR